MAGLVLGIVGATQSVGNSSFTVSPIMKAALAVFISIAGLMLCMLSYLTCFLDCMRRSEKIILSSIYACVPFFIVRLVYVALGDYGTDPRFRSFNGDVTINLVMSVLEEIIITIVLLTVGLAFPMPRKGMTDEPTMLTSQPSSRR